MNKHFVIHPDGTKSTRNSENRTYTHAIEVGPEPREARIAGHKRQIAMYEGHIAEYREVLAYLNNGGRIIATTETSWDRSRISFHMADLKKGGSSNDRKYGKSINAAPSLTADDIEVARATAVHQYEGYVKGGESSIELYTNLITKLEAGPEFLGGWGIVTWCGRYDLAQKQLDKWSQPGREVRIVETERK